MMPIFTILLVAVLNMLPNGITSFTMEMPENHTIRFSKQADGGWSALALPSEELGMYYVEGTKLTAKAKGKEHTQDLGPFLGVDDKTDWAQLKELYMGKTPLLIERQSDGVDFVLTEKDNGKEFRRTFKVRWQS